jgi:hypothetical protein
MNQPTVFISYSHDSPQHAEMVRGLGASLTSDGCRCFIDVYKDTDEDWPSWMSRQLIEVDFVLCVATETYNRRFRDKELPDKGLGVGWEAGMIRRLLYAKKLHNDRIIPVVFSKADRDHIPLEIQGYDNFLLDGYAGYEALLRSVIGVPLYTQPPLGVPPPLATTQTVPMFGRTGEVTAFSPGCSINTDISRILKYAPEILIGRDEERKVLKSAWSKVQDHQPLRSHIITFVALGGEGKSSLVAKWAAELAHQDWPGCDAAFAWSFYSQGMREQYTSSDLFLKEALTFFGDEADKEFATSPAGAFEKGQRLARLVGQRRSLLILDGVEPLQYAPTSSTPGQLKDHGLAVLLKGLAAASHGLCIVTTRYSLTDLRAFWETTAPEVELLRLSRDAGVHLLTTLGVRKESGTPQDFENLVEDVKGHALTLSLLGGFLQRAFRGDIRQRDRVKFEKADARIDGGHAFRTMTAYEQWLLRDGGDEGRREVAVLRLMGLFDRPADVGCLSALRRYSIAGLTEPLTELADEDWEFCLSGLEAAKLLTVNRDAASALVSLDTHPHLREYFAKQLREQNPDAWRAAHQRLYEYLCATTKESDQATIHELQPLYQAVAHGCKARLQQVVFDEVYRERIHRGEEYYSLMRLGAFGSDLGAASCFLESTWSLVSSLLKEAQQARLLSIIAFDLRALGRLVEALDPIRVGLQIELQRQDWKEAAITASNLSELELTLGEVDVAVSDAEHSVNYADRSGEHIERRDNRTTLADALHQAGRPAEAEARFREAEQIQVEHQPTTPLLHSLRGFRYCDLLLMESERAAWKNTILKLRLARQTITKLETPNSNRTPDQPGLGPALAALRAVSKRAAQTIDWEQSKLFAIALDHLTLGRTELYSAILECPSLWQNPENEMADDPICVRNRGLFETLASWPLILPSCIKHINSAVSGLRRAGTEDLLPRALLTRSWVRFLIGACKGPDSAQEDLDEAWEIAIRGPMKLFLADIHLYRARLFSWEREYPWRMPEADIVAAKKLIEQCGYERRKDELQDAEACLSQQDL